MSWKSLFKNTFFKLSLSVVVAIIVIVISYNYLDKGVALSVSQFLQARVSPQVVGWFSGYKNLVAAVVQSDDYIYGAAEIAIALCLLVPFKLKRLAFTRGLAISSVSVMLTYIFKDILKEFFGRCCAKATKNSVLILNTILADKNAMFFHFFHGKANMGLFPSGHMAITCSLVTSLCIYFPRLKILWILFALLMGASLIITNNHFVSDVISGALLGVLTSYCTYRMFAYHKDAVA